MDRKSKLRRKTVRHRMFFESLENRRVLAAATNLASILGTVFDDFSGDGYTAGEEVAAATVNLYLDDGDGIFEPGSGDTLQATDTTDGSGNYRFDNLTANGYFIQQPAQTASGTALLADVSNLINISSTDVQGTVVTTIDSFDTTTQTVTDSTNDSVAATSFMAASEALGGERDFFVNKTSAMGSLTLSANSGLAPGLLAFDSASSGQGQRSIAYDGADNDGGAIDDTGLSAVDITSSGTATGIDLSIGADLAGGDLTVRVYTSDGAAGTQNRFSTATVSIPNTGGGTTQLDFIPFSTFVDGGGGGGAADFTQVGAIEFEIAGAANVNGFMDRVTTAGPTLFTENFDNFESADLSVLKTVDNQSPNVGDNVTYTLTVSNGGPDGATNVALTDTLPAGLTFVSSSATQGAYSNGTGIWTVGSLSSGGSATLNIVATVTTGGSKTNTTQVSASDQFDADSTPGNSAGAEDDQASIAITPAVADLSLTKSASDTTPNVGDNVTFTIVASNAGPMQATNVQVTESLPAGLTFVSASPGQGSFNTGTGVWTVGTIASGNSASLQVVAQVTSTGAKTNTAQVTASDQTDPDSTPNNSNAAEDDQATATVTPEIADLSLTKSVSDSSPDLNDNISFSLVVSNAGPDTATNVQVTDLLPAGLTYVSAVASQGTYNEGNGQWTVGSLANGASETLQINATVNTPGAQTNTAQVTAVDQFDSDSTPNNGNAAEDDQASAMLASQQIDLSLTKSVDNSAPNLSDNITFTVVVSNSGPDIANNVSVLDALPAGLTFVNASQTQGGYNQGTGVWTVGTLGNGSSATLNVTATVNSTSVITNIAQVSAADEMDVDSTPNNSVDSEDDQQTVTVTPQQADLSISKVISSAMPDVGDNVTYTISVSNAGPASATNVSVSDAFPAGLTYVSSSTATGSYDPITEIWTLGTVANGATATLNLTATVNTTSAQTNSVEIRTSDQFDPDSTPQQRQSSRGRFRQRLVDTDIHRPVT